MHRPSPTLPTAPEAEVAVIGGLVIDKDAMATVSDRLSAEDFHDRRNGLIYTTIGQLWRDGLATDPVTISESLSAAGNLDRAGGLAYLAELMDAVPTAANIAYHADIVADRAMRRRLYAAGCQIAEDAVRQDEVATDDALDRAERRVLEVADSRRTEGPRRVQDVMWDAMKLIESGGVKGVPSGIHDLDTMTGGFKPGNLIILAGATSMGKSAMALQIVAHATIEVKVPTALFSIEMTNVENAARLLSLESMVSLDGILNGGLSDADYTNIAHASHRIHVAPLIMDDTAVRVMDIRARARRIKAEHGLGLIVVDHIHDMSEDADSRREEVSKIGRGLKQLAKELDVPVIAVSQLSREPTKRGSPRPRISDLRESGDLEAVANLVILMYRPEYYFGPKDSEGKDIEGKAEAIIAKNRNGPTGSVDMYFRAHCARFEGLAPKYRERQSA